MGFPSIAYVLQEPVGGQVASQAFAARGLVSHGGHGEKLRALDVAALRVGDLLRRKAAALPAGDDVAETHVVAVAGHARRAPAHPVLAPSRVLRAREVTDVFVGRGKLRPAVRRGG